MQCYWSKSNLSPFFTPICSYNYKISFSQFLKSETKDILPLQKRKKYDFSLYRYRHIALMWKTQTLNKYLSLKYYYIISGIK